MSYEAFRIDAKILPAAVEHEIWTQGADAFAAGDYEVAAMHFRKLGLRSKPLYNVGTCYLMLGDSESSIVTLERAVRCDPYLCVAQFSLAYLLQQDERWKEAIPVYQSAIESMRGNKMIDYSQLGLEATVYGCELYFNLAVCYMMLCDKASGVRALINAHQFRCLVRHDVVDQALMGTYEQWTPFEPPRGKLFQLRVNRKSYSLGAVGMIAPDVATSMANLTLSSTYGGSDYSDSRTMLSIAEGESDKSLLTFSAPYKYAAAEERRRQSLPASETQSISSSVQTSYKMHSRSHSMASSIFSFGTSSIMSAGKCSLAKIYKMKTDASPNETSPEAMESVRVISLEGINSTRDLYLKVKEKLAVEIGNGVKLKYRDEDGDLIMLCDDEDLERSLSIANQQPSQNGNLKVILYCFTFCPSSDTSSLFSFDC